MEDWDSDGQITGHDIDGVPLRDGDRVMAWQEAEKTPVMYRRHYSRQEGDKHRCYIDGGDKWTARGSASDWDYVKKMGD